MEVVPSLMYPYPQRLVCASKKSTLFYMFQACAYMGCEALAHPEDNDLCYWPNMNSGIDHSKK
jgi:hypothetical protein